MRRARGGGQDYWQLVVPLTPLSPGAAFVRTAVSGSLWLAGVFAGFMELPVAPQLTSAVFGPALEHAVSATATTAIRTTRCMMASPSCVSAHRSRNLKLKSPPPLFLDLDQADGRRVITVHEAPRIGREVSAKGAGERGGADAAAPSVGQAI